MATTIDKIKDLLTKTKKGKVYNVKFYAESRLDDGRIIATEDDSFTIGSSVKVLEDDGNAYPLGAGTYTLEGGDKVTVDENGFVTNMGDEEETVEQEEVKEEDLEETEDKEKSIEEMLYDEFEEIPSEDKAKEIVAYVKKKMEEEKPEEEMSVEENTEETVEGESELSEFSSVVGELMTRLENVEQKFSDFENTPATQGVVHNPEGIAKREVFAKPSRSEIKSMTTSERAKFMINNKITRI